MQLVFVHGSGGNHAVWHYQTQAFPGADAVDLPGHSAGALLSSIEAYADWLLSHLDQRGYNEVVVVGHSIGGAIGMQCALRHPGRLAGLIPIGSGARLRVLPQTIESLERAVDEPDQLASMLRYSFERVDRALRDSLIREGLRVGAAAFVSDLRACDRFDVVDRISEVEAPTLAICGTDDTMTPPRYSQFLADRIPGAAVEILEGGTHFVFLEQPDAVNRAIRRFVDSL